MKFDLILILKTMKREKGGKRERKQTEVRKVKRRRSRLLDQMRGVIVLTLP
jgi:hypothetical protein